MRVASLLGPDLKRLVAEDPAAFCELAGELHPEDIADLLRELSVPEIAGALRSLPAREAARVFERFDDHEQQDVVARIDRASMAAVVADMAPDRRARLVRVLPEAVRVELLAHVRASFPQAAADVDAIARWPERSAGRLMTTSFVAVGLRSTVGAALDGVRELGLRANEPVYAVYGLDDKHRLAAFARLRDVATRPHERPMTDTWNHRVTTVSPTAPQDEVARTMAKYDLAALPVVDDGTLVGVITIDDVVDVLTEDAAKTFERAGAVEPLDLPYFRTSLATFIRKRGLWLIVLFVEEFFTQTALRHYDPVFEALHGASYYVPLLISTGGNSGSQSATLVIRGMSVREISLRDWWRILGRESAIGVALGLLLGVIGFARVLMYHDQTVGFAVTIGLTLVGIVIVGCTVGSMLPLLLRRLGVDPATSSTPFIASLVDVLGIIVFVHVAKVVMADTILRAATHPAP